MSRVLVARLDSDGDVLLAGPAIRAVAARADEVIAVVGPKGRQAAALLPGVDRVHVWHCGWVDSDAPTLGVKAVGDGTAYCASKFGVVGFTRALAAETAGRIGVTLLVPGGMWTHFFDDRDEQYKPGPDAELNDPAQSADAVLYALTRPPGLVVAASKEGSYP